MKTRVSHNGRFVADFANESDAVFFAKLRAQANRSVYYVATVEPFPAGRLATVWVSVFVATVAALAM